VRGGLRSPQWGRSPALRLRLLLLIPVLLTAAAFPLAAQQGEEREPLGVLVEGPGRSRGLPFLPTNAIAHYRGLYELPEGEATVYYTEQEIVPLAAWERQSCGPHRLRVFRIAEEGRSYPVAYLVLDGAHLFFRFHTTAVECAFLELFISRFRYFRSLPEEEAAGGAPPYPAIVAP
jgi:hypothetical protein